MTDETIMMRAIAVFWRDCPRVPVESAGGKTHADILAPHVAKAARQLAAQKYGRCVCQSPECNAVQISVRAWHIYWKRGRQRIARRVRQARKKRRGWA